MTRNLTASIVGVLLAGVAAAVLPAGPALAHTELTATSPAAKSTVRQPVGTVTLTFSGLVKKAGATVIVTGPDGTSYSEGDARQVDRTITQKVTPLPVGTIKVAWRAVAGDGHPMKGSFTFTNRAAPAASPTPTPPASPTPPPTSAAPPSSAPAVVPASDADASGSAVGWVLGGVALVLLALVGGGLWWRRRAG